MKNFNHRGHREHGVKEFAGGYIKTSEGVVKDRGVGAHLKRHAGAYTGTLIAPVLGTGIGALIDAARKKSNIIKTSELEPAVSDKTAAMLRLRGPVLMSANLKPALRELAARSERITEFAMVRDANGQFVEVEDEGGMGVGTAVKAGAGAAALGGAGYGAYRADKAIMGKYGKQGLLENMDSRNLPSAYAGTTAAGTGAATRGQAYRSALKDVGNSATSRVRQGWAAGNAAFNAAGRRAGAALPVEASGFGAKLLRGIRKGLSVATKMA